MDARIVILCQKRRELFGGKKSPKINHAMQRYGDA
jgi:hypothetical protein